MKIFFLLITFPAWILANANSQETGDVMSTCELMYSAHPHNKAIGALGAERLERIRALDVSETADYSRHFLQLTENISQNVSMGSEGGLLIIGQDLVLGGYAGTSTTTAVIRTTVHSREGYKALLKLASHIGFVYAQDSTLVICEGRAVPHWRGVVSLEITDAGEESFLNEGNAIRLYGLIVGAFNGPENIGYTYYPDRRIFSTLAGLSRGEQGRTIVKDLTSWLSTLSNDDIQFKVDERPVWIFYPHNNWEVNPDGENYATFMADQQINSGLLDRRKQFLQLFDRYFN